MEGKIKVYAIWSLLAAYLFLFISSVLLTQIYIYNYKAELITMLVLLCIESFCMMRRNGLLFLDFTRRNWLSVLLVLLLPIVFGFMPVYTLKAGYTKYFGEDKAPYVAQVLNKQTESGLLGSERYYLYFNSMRGKEKIRTDKALYDNADNDNVVSIRRRISPFGYIMEKDDIKLLKKQQAFPSDNE